MFATLQIDTEKNSFDRVETGPTFRLACVSCRAKKLKCTGEASGCDRCLSRGFTCHYSVDKGSRNRNSDAAKRASVSKAKSRAASINNHSKDGGKKTTPPAPPVHAQAPKRSAPLEIPESERSELQQRSANQEITNAETVVLEGRASNSSDAANRFVMEGSAAFSEETMFDPDADMFDTEDGLGADVWDDLSLTANLESHRLDNFTESTATMPPTPTGTGGSSTIPDLLYQKDFSNRTSGSHLPDFDASFLYSVNIPSMSPNGHELRTQSSQGPPQAASTRSDRTSHPHDMALDPFSWGVERQVNDTFLSTEPCGCVKLALSMLEAISVPTTSISRPEISRTLHLGKRILARCKLLLCCERCRSSSSFVMLLVIISKHLAEAYRRVLELLVEQFNEQHTAHLGPVRLSSSLQQHFSPARQRGVSQLPPRLQQDSRGDDDMNIGRLTDNGNLHGYEFDVEEEPAVFGGVTRLQLSLLMSFLVNVRSVLCQYNRESQLRSVEELVESIKTQLALFGTRPGRIFDRQ